MHNQGFGQEEDEIQIIDKNCLSQETPIGSLDHSTGVTAPAPGTTGPAGPFASGESGPTIPESEATERQVTELLTDGGLGNEEASFYAQHVRRGSALVIFETTEKRAPEGLEIMTQANAKASMA